MLCEDMPKKRQQPLGIGKNTTNGFDAASIQARRWVAFIRSSILFMK